MISLKYKEGTVWKDLDIDQKEIYKVSKQVIDFKDPSKRKIDFSNSFSLPSTPANDAFFNVFYDPTFTGETYSPYSEFQVEMYSGNDLIIKGNLQLESIDREKKFYKVRVFGSLKSIRNLLGERRLNDLDWSDLDHEFSSANVVGSWSGSVTLPGGGGSTDKILYPLADWGKGYGTKKDITVSPGVSVNDFYPAIRYKYLIESIFEKNGLNLDITAFNPSWFNDIFYQLSVDKDKSIETKNLYFLAQPQIEQVFTDTGSSGGKINYKAVANDAGVFDDSIASVVVPGPGNYSFQYVVDYSYLYTDGYDEFIVKADIYKNDVIVAGTNQQFDSGGTFSGNASLVEDSPIIALVGGDVISVKISISSIGSTGGEITVKTTSTFNMVFFPTLFIGGTVIMSNAMGEVKQMDVLRSFLNHWNLILEQDEEIAENFKVIPYDDWLDPSTVQDWEVDVSKPVIVKPATELLKEVINYKWVKSDDFLNSRYRDLTGFAYGELHLDTGTAYTEGKQELFTIFQAYPTSEVPGVSAMRIAKYFKDEDNPSLEKPKPQIFFYNGLQSTASWFYDDLVSPVAKTTYPNCSNFNNILPDDTTQDLNFAFSYPFGVVGANPTELNAYNQYHKKYNQTLYSLDNKIIDCFVFMNQKQFNEFELNQFVRVTLGGATGLYQCLEIKEYPVNSQSVVKVKLMKI